MSENDSTYQVRLYVGDTPPAASDAHTMDLTPDTPQQAVDAIRASGLTPSDLRSRVLFSVNVTSPEARDKALAAYSALLGFAQRPLDIEVSPGELPVSTSALEAQLSGQKDLTRPDDPPTVAQIGGPHRDDIPWAEFGFDKVTRSLISYTRTLRFVPPDTAAHALPQLVAIAAIRRRGMNYRLPVLISAPLQDGDTDGVALEDVRRDGALLRRSMRSDNRDALAEPGETTPRLERLHTADTTPIDTVLGLLGAHPETVTVTDGDDPAVTKEIQVWHCPRPWKHANGDANPSARITAKPPNTFRCFRCDPERVSPLRLLMDTIGCTVDEAADWLEANASA